MIRGVELVRGISSLRVRMLRLRVERDPRVRYIGKMTSLCESTGIYLLKVVQMSTLVGERGRRATGEGVREEV